MASGVAAYYVGHPRLQNLFAEDRAPKDRVVALQDLIVDMAFSRNPQDEKNNPPGLTIQIPEKGQEFAGACIMKRDDASASPCPGATPAPTTTSSLPPENPATEVGCVETVYKGAISKTVDVTSCACTSGATSTLATPTNGACTYSPWPTPPKPTTTVEVANSTGPWGGHVAQNLYDTVLNYTKPKCPVPQNEGRPTNCDSDGMILENVPVYKDDDDPGFEGKVNIVVKNSLYTSTGMRDALLAAAAAAINATVDQSKCKHAHWDSGETVSTGQPQSAPEETETLCTGSDGVHVQTMQDNRIVAEMLLNMAWEPQSYGKTDVEALEQCEAMGAILEGVFTAATIWAPELAPEDVGLAGEIQGVCEDIS